MKRLLLIAGLVFCASHAHAATCPISIGASQSTISSTILGCGSGNTVSFAGPGTYTMNASVNVPCGVSLTGPTVPLAAYTGIDNHVRLGYTPTVRIAWTGGNVTQPFIYGACATARVFQYLEVDMQHPSPYGGQAIYANPGVSNFTIQFNYFHGNQANAGNGNWFQSGLILFDGGQSGTVDDGDNLLWNRFGATGDCSNVMQNTAYDGFANNGGFCNGFGAHNGLSNWTMSHNDFQMEENEEKGYEAEGECVNCVITYNDFSEWHRIAAENQNGPPPISETWDYNSFHDAYFPATATFGLSAPEFCCNVKPPPAPVGANLATVNIDYNIIAGNTPPFLNPPFNRYADAIEWWGNAPSHANYNLLEGMANSFMIGPNGAFTVNNNLIYNTNGGICTPGASQTGYFNTEVNPANTATGSNTCSTATGVQLVSVAPVMNPTNQNFTGSLAWTVNNPGTNRDANTNAWCTTDGSPPVPAAGSSKWFASGTGGTVTSTTTVKCVGMWGAANQPAQWATGYGYGPSAVISAVYTAGATPCGSTGAVLITTQGGAVGDGTTDNTTAINNTFSYAHTNGCKVQIPAAASSFAHSGLLNMNGITVFGVGPQSILKATNASTSAIIMTGTSPSLSDLVIQGTGSSRNTGPNQAGVYVNSATGYTVTDVLVSGGSAPGIWNIGGATGTESNNTVQNTLADSITNTNGANNDLLQNNLVLNSGDDGISNNSYTTDGNTVNHITVNQNTVLHNAFARGLECSGCANMTFSGNYVDNQSGFADIIMASETSSFQTQPVDTVSVIGNTFVHGGPNQGAAFFWPDGSGNAVRNVTYDGNQWFNTTTFTAVQVTGAGTLSGDTVKNSNAYISPGPSFFSSSFTGTGSITQTANNTLATSAYPGPIAPPVAGTIPLFSLPTASYTLPINLSLTEVTSGDAITYCTVSSGTCTPATTYSGPITISVAEVVCALGTNSSSVRPVPSVTICNTYNGGGGSITMTSGFQSNTGSLNTITVGAAAIQQVANGTFSDGSNHVLPFGGYSAQWSSSNSSILGVSTSGLISGTAPGTANSVFVGIPGNIPTSAWGWTVSGATPIPAGGFLGNPGSVNAILIGAGTIPFTATIFYSNISGNQTLPDPYGNTVASWNIIPGSSTCGTVNSSGVFTPTTAGTCNVQAVCSCSATINQWTMTVTAPAPPAPPAIQVIVISKNDPPRDWVDWEDLFQGKRNEVSLGGEYLFLQDRP